MQGMGAPIRNDRLGILSSKVLDQAARYTGIVWNHLDVGTIVSQGVAGSNRPGRQHVKFDCCIRSQKGSPARREGSLSCYSECSCTEILSSRPTVSGVAEGCTASAVEGLSLKFSRTHPCSHENPASDYNIAITTTPNMTTENTTAKPFLPPCAAPVPPAPVGVVVADC